MSPAEAAVEDPGIPSPLLQSARETARGSHRPVVEVLEEMLGSDARDCVGRLGCTLGYPVLDMSQLRAFEPNFGKIDFAECSRRACLVGTYSGSKIAVAADPFDLELQTYLLARGGTADLHIAQASDIAAFLSACEENLTAAGGEPVSGEEVSQQAAVEDVSLASIAQDQSRVVRLVNSTIYDAIRAGASDIHVESTQTGQEIKYRIDGVLSSVATIPSRASAEETVSRIKVMAELDIAERRVPQDGRFKLSVKGHEIDFRVSVMPSLFGEDIVIRILDKRALTDQFQGLRLDRLGFDSATLEKIRRLASEPYGMFLATGPTGSGKSTTLYAALSEILTGRDKIITIEDPVEYQIPGILQIPVNEKKGLTFARGLRSILRHDPDKILVGEIRDRETAEIAIQSALTGHLVFTSVHANSVIDVIGRFQHMGVDLYNFVSALNGVLAQRLIRLNCKDCLETIRPPEELLRRSGLDPDRCEAFEFKRGRGCGQCRGSGHRGRNAIGEVLKLTDDLRQLIASRAPISTLKEAARATGTRFLRELALDLVATGRTTLDEINRVTFAG